VIDTLPEDEVILAPKLVKFPDPETVMLLVARIAFVGPTLEPPLMVMVPEEFKVPDPV
jgi:hypothetical protein